MNYIIVTITLIALIDGSQRRNRDGSWSDEEKHASNEYVSERRNGFDLNGTLRQQFAWDVGLSDPTKSMVCSPLSALLALGKLILGTEMSASRNELLDALGMKQKKVKSSLKSLQRGLNSTTGVEISIAGRIYISNKVQINKKFMKDSISVFHDSVEKVNFQSASATADTINSWVSQKTKKQIKSIVNPDEITADTSIYLVNAIYFAGLWDNPFNKVFNGDFYSPKGTRKVSMMTRNGVYKYYKSETLMSQLIEIPYVGRDASLLIVLPISKTGLNPLLRELKIAPILLCDAIDKMKTTLVNFTMPKFKIETQLDLKNFYMKIGVKRIFNSEKGNLGRLTNQEKLFVSSAVQKAVIEVNEKGTKAAAATSIHIQLSGLSSLLMFEANHPFLFFIKMHQQQLFAGTLVDPEESNGGMTDYLRNLIKQIKDFVSS